MAGEDYGDGENASSMNQGSIDNNYCMGGGLLEPGGKDRVSRPFLSLNIE